MSLTPPQKGDAPISPADFDAVVQKTYGRYPLTITSGSGCTLTSSENKQYLDFVAGIATCVLGHDSPALKNAVTEQMSKVHHVSNLYYTPSQGHLAKWLTENSGMDKAFFCNCGATANEAAIKLARKHASNRGITDPVIITAYDSFHGRTLAAITATAQPKYHQGFTYGGEMVQGFEHVIYNDEDDLRDAVKKFSRTPLHLRLRGRKRGVAAVFLEPLQGEGGIRPGEAEYFKTARELCDNTGALLMCDEVQSGMGRTGKLWGHQNLGVTPDVFTSAKALGGGVPIGAMIAKGQAATTFGPGDHASTYGGNPLACAAALAVAKEFTDKDILANVNARGEQLKAGLEAMKAKYPGVIKEVRGWGLLVGAELSDSIEATAGEVVGKCMDAGLLLVPAGVKVVRFVPPLIVTSEEVDKALSMFENAIKSIS